MDLFGSVNRGICQAFADTKEKVNFGFDFCTRHDGLTKNVCLRKWRLVCLIWGYSANG